MPGRDPRMRKGNCRLCSHHCGHIYLDHNDMNDLVHECIQKLEGGCKHTSEFVCASCRDLMVTVIWQLAKGETGF